MADQRQIRRRQHGSVSREEEQGKEGAVMGRAAEYCLMCMQTD